MPVRRVKEGKVKPDAATLGEPFRCSVKDVRPRPAVTRAALIKPSTESFVLIPGRTSRQGTSLNEGKSSEAYLDETGTVCMSAEDMQRLDVEEGQIECKSPSFSVKLSVDEQRRQSSGCLDLVEGVLVDSISDLSR